jgi:type I restriction enzyme M protein
VSRVKAEVLEIHKEPTTAATTVCDPTCGSGSLLLKVASRAPTPITLYGQEKDAATSGLARMNMILHGNPTAIIRQGNTLADPKLLESNAEGEQLKQFDYVVANIPFSDKRWSTGLNPAKDPWGRFEGFGIPPDKQGDFAYLLHIVRTLKSTGRGTCILPHGVLFRGNAEAEIRKNLIQRGLIKGIIGLPANLFYGTSIPAGIVVIDKRDAGSREGIFLIDASKGFIKDGPKNRLRERDIHKIVDVFSTCPATSTAAKRKTCRTSRPTCAAASPSAISTRWRPTGRCARSCARRCSGRCGPAIWNWRWHRRS